MNKRDESLMFKMADILRGHFQAGEITRINICLIFLKWALTQDSLRAYRDQLIEVSEDKDLIEDLRRFVETVEAEYPILKGVLFSILPGRLDQNMDDLRAVSNAFWMNDWETYTQKDLVDLINDLVMNADGQEDILSTPEIIRSLMMQLIKPHQNMQVADLFSGVGSSLVTLYDYYKSFNPKLYGEEINFEMYGISSMLFVVNQMNHTNVLQKNVYSNPEAYCGAYDYVLMDAPFALSATLEENQIFKYGLPSRSAADWANFQIAAFKLNENGIAIATISTGGLNRSSDLKIRKGMIEDDLIEAAILLPSSLYAHTGIPTALLIFNKNKALERKNQILMIDASQNFVRKNRRQNTLTDEHLKHVIEIVQTWSERDGLSTIVDLDTLRNYEYNLQSTVYLNTKVIESKLGKSITLKEIAEVLPGVQVSPSDLETLKRNPTHYFLNVKNLQEDSLIYDDEERIRDKKINWYGKYDIQAGDLIMTTKGTTAKVVMVLEDFKPAFISNNLTIIRVNPEKYSAYVLLKYLKSDLGTLILDNITTGSGIRNINASKLETIEIPDYGIEKCIEVGERIKLSTLKYKKKMEDAKKQFEHESKQFDKELEFL